MPSLPIPVSERTSLLVRVEGSCGTMDEEISMVVACRDPEFAFSHFLTFDVKCSKFRTREYEKALGISPRD